MLHRSAALSSGRNQLFELAHLIQSAVSGKADRTPDDIFYTLASISYTIAYYSFRVPSARFLVHCLLGALGFDGSGARCSAGTEG